MRVAVSSPRRVVKYNPLKVERIPFPKEMGFWARLFAAQQWRVLETVRVVIGSDLEGHEHTFMIYVGLVIDFASVPKFLRPFFSDALLYGVGAACHDSMYNSGEIGKRIADALLAGLLQDVDGATNAQAEIFFLAVHVFGGKAWAGHRKPKPDAV